MEYVSDLGKVVFRKCSPNVDIGIKLPHKALFKWYNLYHYLDFLELFMNS